jgi:transcriptional regulator with XRE-family HTH domain
MKNRILKILNNERISATKFADIIGVQRSSISHIISGRNKPSFDFIYKTIEKFPDINAEWLINGKGNMYKEDIKEKEERKKEAELFTGNNMKKGEENIKENEKIERSKQLDSSEKDEKIVVRKHVTNVNNIEKVIILLSDGTFKEYSQSD